MLKAGSRNLVIGAMVVLFVLSLVLGTIVTEKHQEYVKTPDSKTPFQALAPALLGFREVAASLLWVKTDDYFHRGEYEPILNMVRLITTIDPHQIDVYTTGAWHMAYNFMDKRLIQTGLGFLEDGVKNNPTIYDLYFECGYTNMDKTKDFPKAMYWYEQASTKGTTDGRPLPPMFTWFQLAHSHEKAGDINGALAQWEKNLARAEKELKEKPEDFARRTNHDVANKNLNMMRWRIEHRRRLHEDPLNANMTVKVTKLEPRKIRIEGTINVLDLARVNVIFRDKNWEALDKLPHEQRMKQLTMEWDNPSIRGGKFKWDLNLNRDPADMGRDPKTIYPLASDEYEIVVTFNPRIQAAFIQDVYGWSGEGITDPQHLVIDRSRTGFVEDRRVPLRLIQKKIIVNRSDVV